MTYIHHADGASTDLDENAAMGGTETPPLRVDETARSAGGMEETPAQPVPPAPGDQAGNKAKLPAAGAAHLDLWLAEPGSSATPPRASVPPTQPFPGGRIKLFQLPELMRFAAEPDQRVIAGFEIGEVGLVLGAPDLGKTTITLGLATAVAGGAAEYLGFVPAMTGPVIVATFEDKPSHVARRIIAGGRSMGASREMIESNLHVLRTEPPSQLFRRAADGLGVEITEMGNALLGKIKLLKPKMLVIEPLVEFHNVSENENGSMHSVMAGLRFFAREGGCAVVVAHHVTRPEEKATVTSSRGAGAIPAAARFALVLNALDKAAAKQLKAAGIDTADLLQVEVGKWNNGAKGGPVILRRRAVSVGPFSAPVLELFRPAGEAEPEGERPDEQAQGG